jgi:peptidoglycan/LPS O-acetylase OafA/YrhL
LASWRFDFLYLLQIGQPRFAGAVLTSMKLIRMVYVAQSLHTDFQIEKQDRFSDPIAPKIARRIVELDGLRALAAGSVLVHHFAGLWVRRFPIGVIGVRTFFVLSGYLITGILLDHRRRVETTGQSPGRQVLRFYGRRILRLLPVLYVAVAAMTLLNLGIARQSWGWDLAYLSNFYAMRIKMLGPAVGHLWTLAIEEQFYLFWPWVILLAPRRRLGHIIIATIAAAPLFRTIGWLAGWHWTVIYCAPVGACDALGLGALLMYCERERPQWQAAMRRFRNIAMALAIPLAILGLLLMPLTLPQVSESQTWHWAVRPMQYYRQAVTDSMLALFGFGLIGIMRARPMGLVNSILRRQPLVYLGTISYGMYVYHIPLKQFYEQYLTPKYAALPLEGSISYFLLLSFFSIALAAVSWHCIERPIGSLKRWLR